MTDTTSTEPQTAISADTPSTSTSRKPRRMAREPKQSADKIIGNTDALAPESAARAAPVKGQPPKAPSKLDQVEALLLAPSGASIAELVAATGWQQHSVRGAMAGALKKRGLEITSDKIDNVRRYRASKPA